MLLQQSYSVENFSKKVIRSKYKVYEAFLYLLLDLSPKCIYNVFIERNEFEVRIDKRYVVQFLSILKNHTWTQYKAISDISAIDYPGREFRFDVVYQLLSLRYNARVNVIAATRELSPMNSVSGVYKAAAWYEREVWDLFGIYFEEHPDLRRILTDYSFDGHPLRKDFPLTGYFEVFYDDTQKRIVYEPVSLPQEFRMFTFTNPWLN